MDRILLLILLFLTSSATAATIGTVERTSGPAELLRNSEKIDVVKTTGVEMQDDIRTGNGVIGIGFNDNTKVQIEKHSKLTIDDFVYNQTSPSSSKLKMKVSFGTVKYASGLIAKNNANSVDIQTPTARIGVRGTAFSMTVDEVGKSLVILLPNADGSVGEITVESDMGQVILTQAYQATVVGAKENAPTKPVILDLSEAQINNLLIIRKPKEKEEGSVESSDKSFLDFNELNIDYLNNEELSKDQLEFTRLDFNLLDVNLLLNILDVLNSKIFESVDAFPTNPIVAGIFEEGNTQIYRDSEIMIYRMFDNRIISLTLDIDSKTQIQINQAGSSLLLHTQENSSDSTIIINQN